MRFLRIKTKIRENTLLLPKSAVVPHRVMTLLSVQHFSQVILCVVTVVLMLPNAVPVYMIRVLYVKYYFDQFTYISY